MWQFDHWGHLFIERSRYLAERQRVGLELIIGA
jgi:hypothetical protein